MTTLLRERLTKALKSALKETQERSKDMIQDNIEAGLMHTESPVAGTFDERELTDMENLINKGDNANTTDEDIAELLEGDSDYWKQCCMDIVDVLKAKLNQTTVTGEFSEADIEYWGK